MLNFKTGLSLEWKQEPAPKSAVHQLPKNRRVVDDLDGASFHPLRAYKLSTNTQQSVTALKRRSLRMGQADPGELGLPRFRWTVG
jgi:hypothetical protein